MLEIRRNLVYNQVFFQSDDKRHQISLIGAVLESGISNLLNVITASDPVKGSKSCL